MKIIICQTAKTDIITRPAQKLVKLLEKDCERNVDVDPFLNGIDYESDNALPSLKVIYDDESENDSRYTLTNAYT